MRIALVGGAETTRGAVQFSQAEEIWTPNWSYKYDYVPRIDKLFEMHPVWIYADTDKEAWQKPREHWDWLRNEHPYPIYMLRKHPDVPASIRYPFEDVIRKVFKHVKRKNWETSELTRARFFTSSFDYMLGLAILKQEEWDIDTIECFGIEMGSDTEYRYQKYGASFFIGAAAMAGIDVIMPHNSVLTKSKMYGLEGGQMIFRTDLERHLVLYNKMRVENASVMNHIEGQYAVLEQNLKNTFEKYGKDDERTKEAARELEEIQAKLKDARDMVSIAAGAFQAVKFLLDEVDLEIPDIKLQNIWSEVNFDDNGIVEREPEKA